MLAIAQAKRVDEVKEIRDRMMAMRLYAQQANNIALEKDVMEIRLNAERRLGEMMAEQKETVGLAKAGRPREIGLRENPISSGPPTLAEAGIDKNLAHRARKLAAMSPERFEEEVIAARDGLRITKPRVIPQHPLDVEKPGLAVLVELGTMREYVTAIREHNICLLTQNDKLAISKEIKILVERLENLDRILQGKPQLKVI
jgi:hypothetical protein